MADREKIDKATRIIQLGIVDIIQVIRTPCDKRSSENLFNLAVYLMDKVEFFKNDMYLDKDFM